MVKTKILIAMVLMAVLLVGCTTTEYVQIDPPEFNPTRPERPELETLPEDAVVLVQINTNMVRLVTYITQLEAYADGWEYYYKEVLTNAGDKKTD